MTTEVESLRAQLLKLQSTITAPIEPEAREKLTKQIDYYKKEWKKRRRTVLDFVDQAAGEGDPKKWMAKVGIETDKAAGVDLKSF